MYLNNINLYRLNNISFKSMTLPSEQKERVNTLLKDYAKNEDEKVRNEIFDICQKPIDNEAKLKSKGGVFMLDEVKSNMYLLFLSGLEVVKSMENPLEALFKMLDDYKPGKDEKDPSYRYDQVSLSKNVRNDDGKLILSDTISNEQSLKPVSKPNEEEQKKVKDDLEKKLANTDLTDREKEFIRLRAKGLTYKEIGSLFNLSDSNMRSKVLSAISKMQYGYNVLPQEYEDKAKELIKIFGLKQDVEIVKQWLINHAEVLTYDTDLMQENITQLSQKFNVDYSLILKQMVKKPAMSLTSFKYIAEHINAYLYVSKNNARYDEDSDILQRIIETKNFSLATDYIYIRGIIVPQLRQQNEKVKKHDGDLLRQDLIEFINDNPQKQFTINYLEDELADNFLKTMRDFCQENFGRDDIFKFVPYTREGLKDDLERKFANADLTDQQKEFIRLRLDGLSYKKIGDMFKTSEVNIRMYTLSAIAKMQYGYNILPQEYDDKANELIQVLGFDNDMEFVKQWLIKHPEILPKDVNKMKKNIEHLARIFNVDYNLVLKRVVSNPSISLTSPMLIAQHVNAYLYVSKNNVRYNNNSDTVQKIIESKELIRATDYIYLYGLIVPQLKQQDNEIKKWSRESLKPKLIKYFNEHPQKQFTINYLEDELADNFLKTMKEFCMKNFGRDDMFKFVPYTKESLQEDLERKLEKSNLTDKQKQLVRLKAQGFKYDEIASIYNIEKRVAWDITVRADAMFRDCNGELSKKYENKAKELVQVLGFKHDVETIKQWLIKNPEILSKDANEMKERIEQIAQKFNIDYDVILERTIKYAALFITSPQLITEHINAYIYANKYDLKCSDADNTVQKIIERKDLLQSTDTIYVKSLIIPQLKQQDNEIKKWSRESLKPKLIKYFNEHPQKQFTINYLEDELADNFLKTMKEFCMKNFGRDDMFKFVPYSKNTQNELM